MFVVCCLLWCFYGLILLFLFQCLFSKWVDTYSRSDFIRTKFFFTNPWSSCVLCLKLLKSCWHMRRKKSDVKQCTWLMSRAKEGWIVKCSHHLFVVIRSNSTWSQNEAMKLHGIESFESWIGRIIITIFNIFFVWLMTSSFLWMTSKNIHDFHLCSN